jgi:probable phosphoglycerate mutase
LERAVETAQPIAEALGLEVRIEEGLRECDPGNWTGKSLASLRRRPEWRSVLLAPSTFRFPEGESFAELQGRIVETLVGLFGRHEGSSFVAVSHADPIRAAISWAAGAPMDMLQRVAVSPCSVSVISDVDGVPCLLCANSTASLAELSFG